MHRRQLIIFALIIALTAPLLLGMGPPGQDDRLIELTVNAGFGGRFRSGQWTPLLLNVSNDGPEIRGKLQVSAATTSGLNAATYSTPIDLPSQSRKQVFLYASFQPFARDVTVELVTGDGAGERVLEAVTVQIIPTRVADLITTVITDSPGGGADLTRVRFSGSNTYQTNWAVENIPSQAAALQSLNTLVFSDVDTGRLSTEQRQAITDWVHSGGHLIVTGGPNFRSTIEGVSGLLPLDVTSTGTVDDLNPLAAFAGRYADELAAGDTVVAVGELRAGAAVLAGSDALPLVARRSLGDGTVDFLAADPGLAPLDDWAGAGALWQLLMTTTQQQPSWSRGFQNWAAAERVVAQTPGFDLPSAVQMFVLLAAYIAFIGPLNFVVLRVFRRTELAWITIPILVVAFSVIAWITGSNLRGTQATINRLSLVQVWPGSDRAQVDGLVGVLSPRRAAYDLGVPEGFMLRTIPQEAGGGGIVPIETATEFEQDALHTARDFLVDAGIIFGLATSGYLDNAPQIDAEATLTTVEMGAGELRGSVSNTTGLVLEDAVVLYRTGAYAVGTLEPGDSASFQGVISPTASSAPLSLVAAFERTSGGALVAAGGSPYGGSGGLDVTARDILGQRAILQEDGTFTAGSAPPDPAATAAAAEADTRLLTQRWNFLNAIAPDADFSGGRGDRVFLVGWVAESPLALDVRGLGWVAEDVTAYVFEIPVTFARRAGEANRVPPSFSTWYVSDRSTASSVTPYNFAVNGGEQAVFHFAPLPSARLAAVDGLLIDMQINVNSPATVSRMYLWHWQNDEWVEVENPRSGGFVIEAGIGPFVGPGQGVRILVEPLTSSSFVRYDKLDVTWLGTY